MLEKLSKNSMSAKQNQSYFGQYFHYREDKEILWEAYQYVHNNSMLGRLQTSPEWSLQSGYRTSSKPSSGSSSPWAAAEAF